MLYTQARSLNNLSFLEQFCEKKENVIVVEGKLFSHQSYKFYYYKLHFCLNTSILKYVCNSLIFSFSLINKLFYHINVSFYILFDLQKLGNTFNTHSGIKNWGLYLIFFCIF